TSPRARRCSTDRSGSARSPWAEITPTSPRPSKTTPRCSVDTTGRPRRRTWTPAPGRFAPGWSHRPGPRRRRAARRLSDSAPGGPRVRLGVDDHAALHLALQHEVEGVVQLGGWEAPAA